MTKKRWNELWLGLEGPGRILGSQQISLWLEGRQAWFLKKLEVGSSLKFPVFIMEKLGLEAGSMVFLIGSGSLRLDHQSSGLAWA